jgi:hypothetical protein
MPMQISTTFGVFQAMKIPPYVLFFSENPIAITMTKDFLDCKPCRGAKAGR